jgi:hypothetical protein
MPIELFTGLPGNGKTAFMVEKLISESKKAERPIIAAGIDGLAPGLAMILEDPKRWNDIDPDGFAACDCNASPELHAHKVPNGSLIFIDEAWKWFGHLHDAARQATPKHVLDLAEHRHRGIDFVWTTQAPNQIYPHARGLIARHTHVVRRFGTRFVDLFSWEELNEDVKSPAKRENAMRATRALPNQVFDQYKSATQHTIKARLPLKLFVLPVAVVLAVGAGWYAYNKLKPAALTERMSGQGQSSPQGEGGPDSQSPASKRTSYATVDDYLRAHTPRIHAMPWTAPVYDGRDVTSDPQLICVKSGAGLDGNGDHKPAGCTCLTEQGTAYAMSRRDCEHNATKGPVYNPYKERSQERRGDEREDVAGAGRGPAVDGPARAAPAVQGINGDDLLQTRYGQFRGTTPPADPAFGG